METDIIPSSIYISKYEIYKVYILTCKRLSKNTFISHIIK